MKKAVLESLANPDGKVRRVFATQSLSMGINCQNFRCVYHWGIPRSLEQYFQQVGREGRDGSHSQAVLLFCDSQLKHEFCTQSTIDYCQSNTCLRVTLMNYFGCKVCYSGRCEYCCSVCASDWCNNNMHYYLNQMKKFLLTSLQRLGEFVGCFAVGRLVVVAAISYGNPLLPSSFWCVSWTILSVWVC